MVKLIQPDDSVRYRALHSVHESFYNKNNVLTAHTDGRWQEFEIKGFEVLEPGRVYQ